MSFRYQQQQRGTTGAERPPARPAGAEQRPSSLNETLVSTFGLVLLGLLLFVALIWMTVPTFNTTSTSSPASSRTPASLNGVGITVNIQPYSDNCPAPSECPVGYVTLSRAPTDGEGLSVAPGAASQSLAMALTPTTIPLSVRDMCDVDASSFPSSSSNNGTVTPSPVVVEAGMCLTSDATGAPPYALTGPYLLRDQRGTPFGSVPLDANGLIPLEYLPPYFTEPVVLMGEWNARTNEPELAPATGTEGAFYFVTTAGQTYLGPGACRWNVGDALLFDGGAWQRVSYTEPAAYEVHSNGGRTWNESAAYPYPANNRSVVPPAAFVDGLLIVADAPAPERPVSFAKEVAFPSAAEIAAANPYATAGNFVAVRVRAYSFANDLSLACGNGTRFVHMAYPPFTATATDPASGLPTRVSLATGYWNIEFFALLENVTPGSESVALQLESALVVHVDPYDPAWRWSTAMAQ